MNQITKKQHYVWRHYLAAWTQDKTSTGQIMCLRNGKVFPVSLTKVANENYFYQLKELSRRERDLIYEIVIKNTTGIQRHTNEQWLNFYCAPFDLADSIVSSGYSNCEQNKRDSIRHDPAFKDLSIDYIEQLHSHIESTGLHYISLLRQNNLDFWQNEEDRDKFSFFLANQYFRTKKIRDAIIESFEICKEVLKCFDDIDPENIWIPLSLIMASNVGAHITYDYKMVLLQTYNTSFIVGDQPVINTYSTFDDNTVPDKMELFYPITPQTALLVTEDDKYSNVQVLEISPDEVKRYNSLEKQSAREMVFANERSQLEALIT